MAGQNSPLYLDLAAKLRQRVAALVGAGQVP